ncbi:hypothetical protein Q5P01_000801 [Channa striata]|uniref:Uncharacterized protein n=1 Tax=Channa striata TaxID=64152 RepID=A0AA88LEN9_CHASR|nr:hypothetical protein Q5P01_000801 [Channa striata]
MNGVRGRKTHRDVIRSRRKAFGIGCDDSRVVRLDYCTKCPGFKDGKHAEAASEGRDCIEDRKRQHTLDELHAHSRPTGGHDIRACKQSELPRLKASPLVSEPQLAPPAAQLLKCDNLTQCTPIARQSQSLASTHADPGPVPFDRGSRRGKTRRPRIALPDDPRETISERRRVRGDGVGG